MDIFELGGYTWREWGNDIQLLSKEGDVISATPHYSIFRENGRISAIVMDVGTPQYDYTNQNPEIEVYLGGNSNNIGCMICYGNDSVLLNNASIQTFRFNPDGTFLYNKDGRMYVGLYDKITNVIKPNVLNATVLKWLDNRLYAGAESDYIWSLYDIEEDGLGDTRYNKIPLGFYELFKDHEGIYYINKDGIKEFVTVRTK